MTKQMMGWLAVACLVAVGGRVGAQEGPRLGRFVVPEYTDDGVKKSELTGESAQVKGGVVEVSGFTITFFETGSTNVKMKVSAPHCTYNRAGRLAKSPSQVTIEGKNMVVTGEDFAWDGPREIFKIFKNSKVVFTNVGQGSPADVLGAKGEADEE